MYTHEERMLCIQRIKSDITFDTFVNGNDSVSDNRIVRRRIIQCQDIVATYTETIFR